MTLFDKVTLATLGALFFAGFIAIVVENAQKLRAHPARCPCASCVEAAMDERLDALARRFSADDSMSIEDFEVSVERLLAWQACVVRYGAAPPPRPRRARIGVGVYGMERAIEDQRRVARAMSRLR